ncbi:MAG: K(+)-transporting ATPase subunit C [Acidimicrobiales bacterium]|jgi:K+-transporting ATPase ATPase C chain|nr:K(+)-transporting ATPase subunit C [Acidimicrobiales bacterium]
MRSQLVAGLRTFLVCTVLLGLAYPIAITAMAQLAFADHADGSLVERDGQVIGSRLLGQAFDGAEWFHPRPSASGYDALASGATNLGPTNPDLLAAVEESAVAYREENGLDPGAAVPVDAVTSSGSGLDPHISAANARLQAPRVAEARGLTVQTVLGLVEDHTDPQALGFLGEEGVHVLELNLALDELTS